MDGIGFERMDSDRGEPIQTNLSESRFNAFSLGAGRAFAEKSHESAFRKIINRRVPCSRNW